MVDYFLRTALTLALGLPLGGVCASLAAEPPAQETGSARLWNLAQSKQDVHRYSTLMTAHNVKEHLSTEEGLAAAIAWCRRTGVTKVYLETFRNGYTAERETLERARDRFRAEGFQVSGCVTTTNVGKQSTGWKIISCYTNAATQDELQQIFEYTARLFDEIMIDDFWFTDCQCGECEAARQSKKVTIGEKTYPVSGDTWEDYRCELMVQLSRDRVLAPARRVNPKVKVIIKYPQWYDRFHERGYDVVRETNDFDRTWVGTETRDYTDKRWGGTAQYEAYFIMRWLGGIGGAKCGGGWFDPYGTTEHTYLEQARQTVLGGAQESLLFCYGSLLHGTGPNNVETLRQNLPELLSVAEQVAGRRTVGVAAYKPASSHPENEACVFDFVGMLGVPLVPCHEFPADAPAAFFSVHAIKDGDFPARLAEYVASGRPVLLTDGLAAKLAGQIDLARDNVRVLTVAGNPKRLLDLPQQKLDDLRAPLLRPLGHTLRAPGRVAFYPFADGSWVIENFNDEPVTVDLDGQSRVLKPRDWVQQWK